MRGRVVDREMRANWVTDPVRWYTHTLRTKPVRPEPMKEISCPNQIRMKTLIPLAAGGWVILFSSIRLYLLDAGSEPFG